MNNPHSTVSHIKEAGQLRVEIRRLKRSVKNRELELQARVKQLPQETLKATIGKVMPALVGNSVAGGAIHLINTVRKLIFSRRKTKTLKEEVVSDVKRIGIITAIRGLAGLLKKRKPTK